MAAASRITSVEAWILPFDSGEVSFGLRAGSAPTGELIFSTTVTIDGAAAEGWHGATNLDWDVAAGDYARTLIALCGFNGLMRIAPPFPAGDEWFDNSGEWLTLRSDNLGWRIGAEPASVAEPGPVLGLLVCGAAL